MHTIVLHLLCDIFLQEHEYRMYELIDVAVEPMIKEFNGMFPLLEFISIYTIIGIILWITSINAHRNTLSA